MFKLSSRGLVPQLFLLIILPITVILIIVAFVGLTLHQQAMRTLVEQRDERAVNAAAQALTDQLGQRLMEIRMLASNVSVSNPATSYSLTLIRNNFLLANFDQGLAFLSISGQLLAASGNIGAWSSLSIQQEPLLEGLLDANSPPGLYYSTTGSNLIFAAAPVSSNGPVIIGVFSPQTLIEPTLSKIFDTSTKGSSYVVDSRHQLLFLSGNPVENRLEENAQVDNAINGQSGYALVQSPSGEQIVAYSSVPPTGWALVIEEPWAEVAGLELSVTEYIPLIFIPVLILTLVVLWYVSRQIIQPIARLASKASELSWGNYDTIESPTGGIAEIQHLQAALIHLAHKVKTYQQGLRDYIGAITLGQEEERHRLARELHDDTLQAIIALKQRVQLAQLEQDTSVLQKGLEETRTMMEQTIQNLRRLTRALRPIYLEDLGLAAALEMLAKETQQVSGVEVKFERSGKEIRLPESSELVIFRVSQEALNNVIHHAQATKAWLKISFLEDKVTLEIGDNGVGFDVPESPAEFAPGGHFGLLGIHERAQLIGAELKIQSVRGRGTRVIISLPLVKTK